MKEFRLSNHPKSLIGFVCYSLFEDQFFINLINFISCHYTDELLMEISNKVEVRGVVE